MRLSASIWLLAALFSSVIRAEPVQLISWNIRLDTAADKELAWPHRAGRVTGWLQQQQPDVLGLQEVLHHQLEQVKQALPGYGVVGVGRDDGKQGGEYSPVLYKQSRFELLDSGTFWLNPDNSVGKAGWDAALPRICSWVLLQDKQTKQQWRVLNLHLDHLGAEARRQSVQLVATKLAAWPQGAVAVVMGDFNPSGDDALLQVMQKALPQYQDVLALTPSTGPAYSYLDWYDKPEQGKRLDFMLVPKTRLSVQKAQLVADDLTNRRSDHLALQAWLQTQ
ncbi:endonuclease/exonuclease/phosphatase family protein [Rheinheimera sp.]|uniref:endonuclease/exonuclease/phosphatase family protein n=1 Tax=Rheinheimera sp. TaxID=1869214 RepID=UPI00307FA244